MDTVDMKAEPSLDADSRNESPRDVVRKRYQELLLEQASMPDKVFMSGHTLQHLDPNLVVLDEKAAEHPRDWPMNKKARSTAIIGCFCFLSPFASTIFAPSVLVVMQDLRITDTTVGALQVSIFLFAFAIGPLFLAPLSERYGRTVIVHSGNLVFLAFSVGGGFSRTTAQFTVCRLFAGIGGSAAIAVVGGLTADVWDLASRAKASGIVMLGPILGPIIGPVCGGWMSEQASWRWTLWVPAIASGILSLIGLAFLDESYAPCVLRRKLKKARKARSNDNLYTVLDLEERPTSIGALFSEFARPIVYLFIDPALLLASIFYSIVFGVVYLILVTFADVFGTGYGHSVGIVGTDLLALGIGMIIGTIATIKAMKAIFKRDESTGQLKYKPESRLISCVVGGLLTVAGLFIYGFTALKTHFIVPLIGCAIFAAGCLNIMLAIQLYAVDGFNFPASAVAAISVIRCIFAGAFPLFGPKLFERLGVDWGVALLAFLVLGFGLPLISLLYMIGPKLRKIGLERMDRFVGSPKK